MIERLPNQSTQHNSIGHKVNHQSAAIDRKFGSFIEDALKKVEGDTRVTFSNHAQKRLDQHGFTLNEQDLTRLDEAVQTLADKGSKQSLILYEDMALITSIQNRKVITALKSNEMNEVTNIDSAIQVKKDA